ncbi:MAG: phosphatidylserine decarboxylase, partial [Desulfofustis sp.]|nr:phosphatidylserine decarboxylase [Desulfofustis sp.]
MKATAYRHQYIERASGVVRSERLFGDPLVRLLYGPARERAPVLFKALTSARMSSLLGWWCYDRPHLIPRHGHALLRSFGVDPEECCETAAFYDSYRKVFERQIRYWHCRPLPADPEAIVAPADARVLIGSQAETSLLLIKEKLFGIDELLGDKAPFLKRFTAGDFAVFRLTPDKYHYNHLPVSGRVIDLY